MNYIIGVDSGGTKTEATAFSLEGEPLEQCITGFGNPLVDYDIAVRNIKKALQTIFSACGKDCKLVVIGLAGVDSSGQKERLESEFSFLKVPIMLINDGKLAHLSILKGKEGILAISGTGSLVLGYQTSQWLRVGGWGHLLGDEGSAYDIAKKAIQRVLFEEDSGQTYSELSVSIMNYLQVTDVLSLVKIAYQLNKGEFSKLAAVVGKLSTTNELARGILIKSAEDLAKQTIILINKMGNPQKRISIGINGSVIEKNQLFRKAFFTYLSDNNVKVQECEKTEPTTKGAYYLFKEGWQNK
ncbi:hypothetical protein RV11_GL002387 [Enterococcus phoeniculicola]|jgi:N-acetylglucosamine kinase-like BadF-type ATPase|uniref:ATPase BadF/BadG/BcrA/BcrD type domain-containing protein n=1 Tax=Enterococcus phoeniculicola ATCC BAA-412 TaxID=1158610 RepID=R3WS37_9ENTE|nr:BadF/BadG/BcrA/BcrD ATPase family protein [Enterococcus phoeniculicola]EOL44640.1 hypothetical protein UC3_01457 [Enterococcus phoeniculicola ATCC BAA-412]EOT74929.1 hypothetical protein I589_02529 [Enterococcus phoeniculicola ATCC BAA-412]OJG72813.1 hypothetical protein RV11_GL002387 [Enterococcus phoeniculicola]